MKIHLICSTIGMLCGDPSGICDEGARWLAQLPPGWGMQYLNESDIEERKKELVLRLKAGFVRSICEMDASGQIASADYIEVGGIVIKPRH